MDYMGKGICKMKELSQEQCIEIRKETLKEFHKMCEKNEIRYSLGYGSLLGAVRHGGMIPWDDDIDVIVSRNDFEKLCKIYSDSHCKDRYQFVSHENHPEIKTKIGYFIDFSTVTETAFKTNEYHGVHIDVYPVDVVPSGRIQQKALLFKRWILLKIIRAKDVHPEVMHGVERLKRQLVQIIVSPFSYDKVLNRLQSLSQKFMNLPDEKKEVACILVETGKPLCFPFSITREFKTYDYEGEQYWGFKEFDSILKLWYGDYMTPPPSEDRHRPEHKFVRYYLKED